MGKFDATLKDMLEAAPGDWAALAGISGRSVIVIDADISTVTGAADKVLLLQDEPASLLHFEFQAGPDDLLPQRMNVYNAVLEHRHGLPVRSIVVLLHPQANLRNLTGVYESAVPGEAPYRTFHYGVLRVWEMPVELLLDGGLGTVALATISAVTEDEVPDVFRRLSQSLLQRTTEDRAYRLWRSALQLMKLRYGDIIMGALLDDRELMDIEPVRRMVMRELTGELRKVILSLGQHHFGAAPPKWFRTALEAVMDLNQLEQLPNRVIDVHSWEELLPPPRRRSTRKKTDS
jgi:hypothetical protein